MKLVDTDDTVLVVTGIDVPAEMNDRPLGYRIKAEIDRRGGGRPFRAGLVVSDAWFAQNRIFHLCPVVSVGGPGVNAVAASLVEDLPFLIKREDRVFVQGSWDGEQRRVSLWGMDRVATAEAVEAFLTEGYCDAFLRKVWKSAGESAARSPEEDPTRG